MTAKETKTKQRFRHLNHLRFLAGTELAKESENFLPSGYWFQLVTLKSLKV